MKFLFIKGCTKKNSLMQLFYADFILKMYAAKKP